MVPNWKKELDALVAETMAFTASVNARRSVVPSTQVSQPVADATASSTEAKEGETVQADPDPPVLATVEAVLAEPTTQSPLPEVPSPLPGAPSPLSEPTTWPTRLPPLTLPPSERDEIKQRLTNFKTHQLRMQAERESFYGQTMARTRAVAAGSPPAKPVAE
jgi:hypothetical protein